MQPPTFEPCKVRLEERHPGTRLTLSGSIDERAKLEPFADSPPPLTVDLAGVVFVNSVGLREWIHFLRAARSRGPVTLTRCSDRMVMQLNMVADAVEGATVESFLAPYGCDACDHEETVELNVRQDFPLGRRSAIPARACSRCGQPMKLAESPSRYLLFLGD